MTLDHALSIIAAISTTLGMAIVGILSPAEGATVINEQTAISLGVALLVVGPVAGGIIWLKGALKDIASRLASIEEQHEETWSYNAMKAWALELRVANPTLTVPMPEPPLRRKRAREDA